MCTTDRRDLATATELGKAQGVPFSGGGVRLSVQSVQTFSNGPISQKTTMVVVALDGGPAWAYDASSQGFELTDAESRRIRPAWANVNPVGLNRRWPGPEELAVFGAASGAGLPGALPWAALALNAPQAGHGWTASLQFVTPDTVNLSTAKLTFYRYRRLRTELPFEFRDLPLP